MSKRLSRKEKEQLIAKELAKEKYLNPDNINSEKDIDQDKEYEVIEISNLRQYNRGTTLPITIGLLFFVLGVFSLFIYSALSYNKDNSEIENIDSMGMLGYMEVDYDNYDPTEIVDKKDVISLTHNNDLKVLNGVKTFENIKTENNADFLKITYKIQPYDDIFYKNYEIEFINKDGNIIQTITHLVDNKLDNIIKIPENTVSVNVNFKDNIEWELSLIDSTKDINIIRDKELSLTDFKFMSISDNCSTIYVNSEVDTLIRYGSYNKDNIFITSGTETIKGTKLLNDIKDNVLIIPNNTIKVGCI